MNRPVRLSDAATIAAIYNYHVEQTIITFEEVTVTADEIQNRIRSTHAAKLPWLVSELEEQVVGYAYANPWRSRSAYRFTAEAGIYVAEKHTGKGIGSALYSDLLTELTKAGIHCVLGSISLPNPASIALHERMGFEKVAHHPEVGRKFDQWIDVGFWQKQLSYQS